jgi:hypothetical protein
MPLTFQPTRGFGAEHFSAFEGERKIGRIYKTAEGDWFWGVDWFEAGSKLVTDYAPTLEQAMAEFKEAWTDMLWAKLLAEETAPRNTDTIARASETNPPAGTARLFKPDSDQEK